MPKVVLKVWYRVFFVRFGWTMYKQVLLNGCTKPIKNTAADFQCSKDILYNSQVKNAASLVNN